MVDLKTFSKRQLEIAEEGLSGVDRIGSAPIEGVEVSPGVPARTLGEQLRAIAARAVGLLAKPNRSGIIKASRDVADPTAIEVSEKGVAGGVPPLGNEQSPKIPLQFIPDTILGGLDFQTAWNAATNTPNLNTIAKSKGDYWVVSTPGDTSLGGIAS